MGQPADRDEVDAGLGDGGAVSSVTPPEASMIARPAIIATASAQVVRATCCRAARRRRRPRSASSSWSSVSTSTSILTRWPTCAAHARGSPSATPPATAMWLSLISTASSRPKRWLAPPPQRTAYFSKARSSGVVLRVQTMRALVPATAATSAPSATRRRRGGRGNSARRVRRRECRAPGLRRARSARPARRARRRAARSVEDDRGIDQAERQRAPGRARRRRRSWRATIARRRREVGAARSRRW